ncbi:MAG TPA: hypothetical protein VJ482_03315 [Acidimicrobiia bacterium]|nr:hypothetical protein [Acidimicrobiia bacterium]
MSPVVSEFRSLAGRLMLAAFLALAPSSVPEWRMSASPPPALVLLVGDPVRWIFSGGNR